MQAYWFLGPCYFSAEEVPFHRCWWYNAASEAGAVEQLRYQEVLVWSLCPSWEVAWPGLQGRRNQQHTLYKDLPWQYNEAMRLQFQALLEK